MHRLLEYKKKYQIILVLYAFHNIYRLFAEQRKLISPYNGDAKVSEAIYAHLK
jgi:hypothetical protein